MFIVHTHTRTGTHINEPPAVDATIADPRPKCTQPLSACTHWGFFHTVRSHFVASFFSLFRFAASATGFRVYGDYETLFTRRSNIDTEIGTTQAQTSTHLTSSTIIIIIQWADTPSAACSQCSSVKNQHRRRRLIDD